MEKKEKFYVDTPSYLELCIKLKMLGIAGPYCGSNLVCNFSLYCTVLYYFRSSSTPCYNLLRMADEGYQPLPIYTIQI